MRNVLRRSAVLLACATSGLALAGCAMSAGYAGEADAALAAEDAAAPPAARAMPEQFAAGSAASPAAAASAPVPGPPQSPAGAVAPQIDPTGPATNAATRRVVIYSAAYRVVVADVAGALRAVQQAAERLGGHLQEVSGSAVTVRVPAGRFADACRVVEETGEVVDRQVRAQDVTEEMRDLGIRLENAEKLRQRLIDLLAKAEKVEDAIKIEAELARVAEQIDGAKGKIRFLESRAALSTIRVELNSPVAQNPRGTGPRLPFAWVEQLGDGLVAGQVRQETRKLGFFSRGPRFVPPPAFVRFYEEQTRVDAMDAGGLQLRVQRRPNADRAPLAFWAKLARRSLVEGRAVAVESDGGDANVYLLSGGRDVGGKPVGYLLGLKRSDKGVAVFEAWGPKDEMDRAAEALRVSAESVDPD